MMAGVVAGVVVVVEALAAVVAASRLATKLMKFVFKLVGVTDGVDEVDEVAVGLLYTNLYCFLGCGPTPAALAVVVGVVDVDDVLVADNLNVEPVEVVSRTPRVLPGERTEGEGACAIGFDNLMEDGLVRVVGLSLAVIEGFLSSGKKRSLSASASMPFSASLSSMFSSDPSLWSFRCFGFSRLDLS